MLHRIAFSSLKGLSPAVAGELLARVGSEETFFALPSARLADMMGFSNRLFADDVRGRALEDARREEEFIARSGVRAIYFTDPSYPERLKRCDDAPLMLYALGECDLNRSHFISIVGTRHATSYGTSFVDSLVSTLAATQTVPPVIVSGLAYGIDVAAHKAALREGLPTVGVLAHGLNTIYPAAHRDTAVRMARSGGMLLTDYRSIDSIHRGNFLARNRIVAGMCDCLIVAESDIKGGALVTARLASAYHRDVFALPGRIGDRYSRGCNHLISSSIAQLLDSPEALAEAMGWPVREPEGSQPGLFPELTPEEQTVTDLLTTHGDMDLSALTAATGIPVARLMGMLVDMEFRSLIRSVPGGRYCL